MEEPNIRSGCISLGLLSLIACVMGTALAAAIFVPTQFPVQAGSWAEGAGYFLTGTIIAFLFGAFIAVPIGLMVGIPLLALSQRYLSNHVIIATLAFAVLGLLGGLAIKHFGGGSGLGNAEPIFGACVGGMHPLIYGREKGVPWFKIAAAFLLSAAAVPSLAYAGEDVGNLTDSEAEFESRCADRYGSMAFVADRAALERFSDPVESKGKWYNQRALRSLYAREDRVPLDRAHVLIARDYAYVPSGFAGWITGGRRVERHCLSEKKGVNADMLRGRGFGKRPRLQDLAD
jgi:hypothetical protein